MNQLPILNCDDCGACCMAIGHPQFYRHRGDPHWQRLPEQLKQQINRHVESLEDIDIGRPCLWLDMETRHCRHYDYRPQMCRDFELGNPHCERMRASHGIEPFLKGW